MPRKPKRSSKSIADEGVATRDSAVEEENDPSEITEFDQAMRALIRVPKAELDAKIHRGRKSARRK
jgi:hypothetical protein